MHASGRTHRGRTLFLLLLAAAIGLPLFFGLSTAFDLFGLTGALGFLLVIGLVLVAPPVPEQFVDRLRVWGPWRWGTEDPSEIILYNLFEPTLQFVITLDVFLVGHAGHGFNSWALTYLLGFGPLALGVQIPWGGVYEDRRERAEEVERRFEQIGRLIERAEGAKRREGRLLVVHSGLVGQGALGWVRPSDALETGWIGEHLVSEDVLDLAVETIA